MILFQAWGAEHEKASVVIKDGTEKITTSSRGAALSETDIWKGNLSERQSGVT